MQELVREYLNELGKKQRKRRRTGIIAAAFAIVVAGGVIWGLIQSGIAMTGEAKCGIEEHTHGAECYTKTLACGQEESTGHIHGDACYQTEQILICGQEEGEEHTHEDACYQTEQVLVCGQEESEGHTHTDGCYSEQLTCDKQEHIHTDACFIDNSADVEDASQWDAQYRDIKWENAWGKDLVTAAEKQIGYKESTKNYAIAADGSHKGYTRYGQFAGDVYADWDAAFVNFCLHYAGLEESQMFPNEKLTAQWYEKLVTANEGKNKVYLTTPDGYEPEAGDLVFFQKEGGETETQMGIVASYNNEKNEIRVIEGNSGNEVKENKYSLDDKSISEYLMVTEMEKTYKGTQDADESDENADETADGTVFTTEGSEDAQITEEEEDWAYEESYDADKVIIHVSAKEGVVPEGAELSVTPIEKQEVTDGMSRKEAKEAEEINAQYELTEKKLQEESEKKEEILEGFLAYDICFLVDGEEVEPSGDVKVTMDFKEAVKPEGVSENATVVVNHLKEDESAEDGVVVENLTEKEETTITTEKETASVEKVELVADGFSTFTIVWVDFGARANIETEYVDEEGKPIEGVKQSVLTINVRTNMGCKLKEEIPQIISDDTNQYELEEIKVVSSETGTVYQDKTERIEYGTKNGLIGLKFCNEDGKEFLCSIEEILNNLFKIQLKYVRIEQLSIKDDIAQSGELKAIGVSEADYPDKEIQYVWYKRINSEVDENGEPVFNEVRLAVYKGEGDLLLTNIGDDGKSINVALDQGALNAKQSKVEYKVKVLIDKKELFESEPFSIPYYDKVQNGDFESPRAIEYNECFFPKEEIFGWNTTTEYIELVRPAGGKVSNSYHMPNIVAPSGAQFAELNAHEPGILYQDILTMRGKTLWYSFSHRARSLYDYEQRENKLYLVMVPTQYALKGIYGDDNPIDTRGEVEYLMEHKEEFSAEVLPFTANTDAWTLHRGEYQPEYNLIRFFFVSAELGDLASRGNFLDNVWFSQEIVPADNKMFNLRVEKIVDHPDINTLEELEEKQKELGLSFTIRVTEDGKLVNNDISQNVLLKGKEYELDATDMKWESVGDGTFRGWYDFYDNYIEYRNFEISVQESYAPVPGYDMTKTSNTVITTQKVVSEDGKEEVIEEEQKIDGSVVPVREKQKVNITFTNTYVPKSSEPEAEKKICVKKEWEDFDGSYGIKPDDLQLKFTLTGKYQDSNKIEHAITEEDFEGWKISAEQITSIDDGWEYTWEKVPVYYENNKNQPIEWIVTEQVIGSKNPYTQKDYTILRDTTNITKLSDTVNYEEDETHIFTNVLKSDAIPWSMVKYSTSGKDKEVTLEGAKFELKASGITGKTVATGESKEGEDGVISWTQLNGTEGLAELTGDFVIVETQAPEGFSLTGTHSWKVKLVNGIPYMDGSYDNVETDGPNENGITIYIGNTPLYSLPESGGSGIYWYMFSGILLMAGAALITYKKRCREVLKG